MINTPLTRQAMCICYYSHQDQMDKNGVPYVFHPAHVAESMTDEYSTCVALLHDVLEDTACTEADLRKYGMPEEVIEACKLMTRDPEIPYLDYVRNLADNPICAAVKLADLRHNSDLTRLDKVTERDLKRVEKYRKAMEILGA